MAIRGPARGVVARGLSVLLQVFAAASVASVSRADTREAEGEVGRPPAYGVVGVRALAALAPSSITVPGGRDYLSREAELGWGFRLDAGGYLAEGLILGCSVALASNALEPGDESLVDFWVALTLGYRIRIHDRLVVTPALGFELHIVTPAEGGEGAALELSVAWEVVDRFFVGIGTSFHLLMGFSESQPVTRVVPSLLLELEI